MPYAVIVPGISAVYNEWKDVERVIALYPYPKFRKFATEEDCWEFVRRNTSKKVYTDITKYGETFDNLCVSMEYFILEDKVCYNFKTNKAGYLCIENDRDDVIVTNRSGNIKVSVLNIHLNNDIISNHLIAIWHGLKVIGDYVDVDIKVPDHSIFYALMTYKGTNKTINRVRDYIDSRFAKVSVTMKDFRERKRDYGEQ